MVNKVGVQSLNINNNAGFVAFGAKKSDKRSKCENQDVVLAEEMAKHPVTTNLKIQTDKFVNAWTKYPIKGLKGSKNANFYEFLTMGTVPYLTGSAMMIAVFNLASKYFDTPAAANAQKLGKSMGIGVAAYGVAKTLSKKLIEKPVKWKHGIDMSLPYKKIVYELPEEGNKNNLVTHEYHKVFESVDFPRWDLLYGHEYYGKERNAYFNKIADKMNIHDGDLAHSDQKVKPKIREKVVQSRVFSTLISYLWAGTAVAVSMQEPFGKLKMSKHIVKDFGSAFVKSCKEFVNHPDKATRYAGRALLGTAVGVTLLGNFVTLFDFNKDKGSKTQASTSLIDNSKEKVVC